MHVVAAVVVFATVEGSALRCSIFRSDDGGGGRSSVARFGEDSGKGLEGSRTPSESSSPF